MEREQTSHDKRPFTRQVLDSLSAMTIEGKSRIRDDDCYSETPQGIAAYLIEQGLAVKCEAPDNLELNSHGREVYQRILEAAYKVLTQQ